MVKNPPANAGDLGSVPGSGRSLGEGNGSAFQYFFIYLLSLLDSSIFAWEIPWAEEPGRLLSMGPQRVGHDLATKQQHIPPINATKTWRTLLVPTHHHTQLSVPLTCPLIGLISVVRETLKETVSSPQGQTL